MERHAALPDLEDLERMREVVGGLVEQHIAQTPAQDHAEHAVEQHVVEVARGPAARSDMRLAHAQAAEPQEHDEAGQVHQAVPADGQRAQVNRDRVELRMNEHGGGEGIYIVCGCAARRFWGNAVWVMLP
ncbi:hypothetical protein D3C81_1435600 [compost metagenome]